MDADIVAKQWTAAEIVEAYRQTSNVMLAERVEAILAWADTSSRLVLGRTRTPAFGIVGNRGRRIISIREHGGGSPLSGRISMFPGEDGFSSEEERQEIKRRLLAIAMPAARPNNSGSWDAAFLSAISQQAFADFIALLEWLGPAAASDSSLKIPIRVGTVISRIVRDSKMIRDLKALYGNSCQICGHRVQGLYGWSYSEAHHVQPLGEPHNGPDTPENVLVLCPNHHAMLDYGAGHLDTRDLRFVGAHRVDRTFIDYHNHYVARRGD